MQEKLSKKLPKSPVVVAEEEDRAQAGGKDPKKIPDVIKRVKEIIKETS
jgi:hypothetical protein